MFRTLRNLWRRSGGRKFKLFQIEPTMRCNLRCVMCPWHSVRSPQADMRFETYQRIAAWFPEAEGVDLTGTGEPLLHPRVLDMVRVAKDAGCSVGLSTNATLLSREASQELVTLGLDWIAYSVDASTAPTYEKIRVGARFQSVLDNMRTMKEVKENLGSTNPKTLFFFVMMRNNVQELPAYVDMAHRLGIDQVVAKNMDVITDAGLDSERLFTCDDSPPPEPAHRAIAEARAKAVQYELPLRVYFMQPQEGVMCEQNPLSSIFFTWEGYVSPCVTLAYAEGRMFCGEWRVAQRQRFGDINTEELEDIWESRPYGEFRQALQARVRAYEDAALDLLTNSLGPEASHEVTLPPAPAGCQVCHYLYGI